MVCFPRLFSVSALLVFASFAPAQETALTDSPATTPSASQAPIAAGSGTVSPLSSTATTTTSAPVPGPTRKRSRAISGELATSLAAGMPKYDPPKPIEKKLEDEELPDMREIDKPRNEIIRLPKVIVEGSRPPIFTEKEIMTRKAYAELLAKRYYSESYRAFSKAVGYTPLRLFIPSAEDSAMSQYYAEERLRGMAVISDAANTAEKLGDKNESDYLKRTSAETYMNRSDFGWHNTTK